MAYDNYTNLKKAVLGQTHRKDLGDKFNDFLTIAEVEIRSNPAGSLKMNLSESAYDTVTSTVDRFLALPLAFQSSRNFTITIDDNIRNLEFRMPGQLNIRSGTGIPCFFTVSQNQIEFDVLPSEAFSVKMLYTANVTGLSTSNLTNDILTKYPNIYLYGCLKQAFTFTEDLDEAMKYGALFLESIDSANNSEHDIKYSNQPQETVAWAP